MTSTARPTRTARTEVPNGGARWPHRLRARLRARSLREEADAILGGRAVSLYTRRARTEVPEWARLNPFAHRNLAWLRCQRSWSFGEQPPSQMGDPAAPWRWADSRIARDLLAACAFQPARLAVLQREVLVPLEMELLRMTGREPLGPVGLTALVRSSLEAHSACFLTMNTQLDD